MNRQEVFDKVVNHLLTQNEKAMDELMNDCLYRTKDGKTCAVGCLIPEDVYHHDMEYTPIFDLVKTYPKVATIIGAHQDILTDLQQIHDSYEPHDWPEQLIFQAKINKLIVPEELIFAMLESQGVKRRKPIDSLPDGVGKAIDSLLTYMWEREAEDWLEMRYECGEDHIFADMVKVNNWLYSQKQTMEEAAR